MAYRTFRQNPAVDFLFGEFGGPPVPTKQESYKAIGEIVEVDEDSGAERLLQNFYVKNPDTISVREYRTHINNLARNVVKDKIILKPYKVEVLISISLTKKNYETFDVDNLAKTILDGLIDAAFEDDSQVTALHVSKHIHPLNKNGSLIAITKITDQRKGLVGILNLFSEVPNK